VILSLKGKESKYDKLIWHKKSLKICRGKLVYSKNHYSMFRCAYGVSLTGALHPKGINGRYSSVFEVDTLRPD
jgi:hypothetical protein